jgi:hypothetical protein
MQMKWLAGICGIGLLLLLAGLAGAWWIAAGPARRPWTPPPQPQIARADFSRIDGSEPTIRLAGHWSNVHIEYLLAGFRDQATPEFEAASDDTWVVTIVDTDGRNWKLAVRSQGQGQVWHSGVTTNPVQGDLDLFLEAHRGIQILNLASSGDAADRLRLEEAVAADGDAAIDPLRALAKTTDDRQRAIALQALNMIVSPRLRRVARLNAGVDECGPHNAARAADHPRAAEVRELAVSILDAWSADPSAATSFSMTERALFESLAELRDQNIADKLAAALRKRPDADYLAERIMQVLEEVYGLPPIVEPLHFCPTGERDPHYLVGYPISMQSTFRPLLVQGTDVLPALTDAQERTPDLPRQAAYEALITIISGQRDETFLAELMQGDPVEREMAHKIRAIPAGG